MTEPEIDKYGNKTWKNSEGQWHRIGGPAYIGSNGTQFYFENGKRHRIGGPACISYNGKQYYYINDKQVTELEHDLMRDIMDLKGLI